jgi:hypothetical protein
MSPRQDPSRHVLVLLAMDNQGHFDNALSFDRNMLYFHVSPAGHDADRGRAEKSRQHQARDREVDDDAGHVHERATNDRGARGSRPARRNRNAASSP